MPPTGTVLVYTIKIFKAWAGRTANQLWSNTYHAQSATALDDPAWVALLEGIAGKERSFHLNDVNFMRATISTTNIEDEYDPHTLRVFELQGTGERGLQGNFAAPLDMAFKCKKNVQYGRSGTVFYRGVLHTGDYTVGAGGNPNLNSTLSGELINGVGLLVSSLADELAAMNGNFVMGPGKVDNLTPVSLRNVLSLSPSGISINKRNHRYFDKAQSDDGVGVGT